MIGGIAESPLTIKLSSNGEMQLKKDRCFSGT